MTKHSKAKLDIIQHEKRLFFKLKHVKVLAVLELPVLLAEEPREHLTGLHARPDDAPGLVPVLVVRDANAAAATTAGPSLLSLADLEPNLAEDSHQEVVYVVLYAHRDLGELGSIRARQTLAVCNKRVKLF